MNRYSRSRIVRFAVVAVLCGVAPPFFADELQAAEPPASAPPAVGGKAPNFTLKAIDGKNVSLAETLKRGPAVVIVLRGYPGYQCPLCTRQVADLLKHADEIKARRAQVLMIYPGPSANLRTRAEEFIRGQKLPGNVSLLVDPDYAFVSAYGLRWDAPNETAYPSTFVINPDGPVRFAKISKTHGGRSSAAEVVKTLAE